MPVRETPSRNLFPVFAGLMLALALAALDQNIVATALPRITGELGGLRYLSWVVTSFVVTSTVSTPFYGRLSDLYGRKPAFVVSIALFLIGSVLCGVANGMAELIGFRALQGLGAGGLMVLAQTVIADLVPPRERGRYQGLFAAVFAVCSVAGPLLGGFITDYASWRWIFYVNLPLGAAALALIIGGLPPRAPGPVPRLDVLGACLLIVGTCCLLLMLSWGGGAYPWLSAPIIGLAAASTAAFGLLVPVEQGAAQPLLPPELFRNRVFVVSVVAMSLTTMAMFTAAVFLPLMFQLLMSASPSRAGLMISPMMGGVIVASFVGGRVVTRTGRYKTMPVIGLPVVAFCFAALTWGTLAGLGVLPIIALLILMGLGVGLVMPNLTTAIQNAVPRNEMGGATASAAFFRSLGSALGVALAGSVLAAHLHDLPNALQTAGQGVEQIGQLAAAQRDMVLGAYRAGLAGAFAVGAAIAALGFLVVLLLPDRMLSSGSATM